MTNSKDRSVRQDGFMTIGEIAEKLSCSVRHCYRLVETGAMPKPIKLGQLVRWPRKTIEAWMESGCKPCA